jgi:hypothetical protein
MDETPITYGAHARREEEEDTKRGRKPFDQAFVEALEPQGRLARLKVNDPQDESGLITIERETLSTPPPSGSKYDKDKPTKEIRKFQESMVSDDTEGDNLKQKPENTSDDDRYKRALLKHIIEEGLPNSPLKAYKMRPEGHPKFGTEEKYNIKLPFEDDKGYRHLIEFCIPHCNQEDIDQQSGVWIESVKTAERAVIRQIRKVENIIYRESNWYA